jgi:hypothetical protein
VVISRGWRLRLRLLLPWWRALLLLLPGSRVMSCCREMPAARKAARKCRWDGIIS